MGWNCGCPAWARGWRSRLLQAIVAVGVFGLAWWADGWAGVACASIGWSLVGVGAVSANWLIRRRRGHFEAMRLHDESAYGTPMQDDALARRLREQHQPLVVTSYPPSTADQEAAFIDSWRKDRASAMLRRASGSVLERADDFRPEPGTLVKIEPPAEPFRFASHRAEDGRAVRVEADDAPRLMIGDRVLTKAEEDTLMAGGSIPATPRDVGLSRHVEYRASYGERALRIEWLALVHRWCLKVDGVIQYRSDSVERLKAYALEHLHVGGSLAGGLLWSEVEV